MGLNSAQVILFFVSCSHQAVVLHNINNYYTTVVKFFKIPITIHRCLTLFVVARVDLISQIHLSDVLVSPTVVN